MNTEITQEQEEALFSFLSPLSVPVYAAGAVPAGTPYPYLTYEEVIGAYGEEVPMTLVFRDRSDSFASLSAFSRAMEALVPEEGASVSFSGGKLLLFRGGSFLIRRGGEDPAIRRLDISLRAVCLYL